MSLNFEQQQSETSPESLPARGVVEKASNVDYAEVIDEPSTRQIRLDSDATLADEKGLPSEPTQSAPTVRTIDWDGPQDPENPKNWSSTRKWAATITVAMFTFISPIASSMVAPALEHVARDLDVPPGFQTSLLLSIFVLAYAVGPLVLGPLSEVFGRTKVLQSAFMFFMVFCLACGFAQSKAQFLVFRIISGLGGSAPLAIGPGVLSDLWAPEQRGKALGYYTAGPLLGPAIGMVVRFSVCGNPNNAFRSNIWRLYCSGHNLALGLLGDSGVHWSSTGRGFLHPQRNLPSCASCAQSGESS
jgi:hypothetical protein